MFPFVLAGYQKIIANSYPTQTLGIIVNYFLTSTVQLEQLIKARFYA